MVVTEPPVPEEVAVRRVDLSVGHSGLRCAVSPVRERLGLPKQATSPERPTGRLSWMSLHPLSLPVSNHEREGRLFTLQPLRLDLELLGELDQSIVVVVDVERPPGDVHGLLNLITRHSRVG